MDRQMDEEELQTSGSTWRADDKRGRTENMEGKTEERRTRASEKNQKEQPGDLGRGRDRGKKTLEGSDLGT